MSFCSRLAPCLPLLLGGGCAVDSRTPGVADSQMAVAGSANSSSGGTSGAESPGGSAAPMTAAAGSGAEQQTTERLQPSALPATSATDAPPQPSCATNPNLAGCPTLRPVGAVPAQGACTQLVDFDQLYQLVNQDLTAAASADRPFLRYLSLTNRATAGVCASSGLDADRRALIKGVNLLSRNAQLRAPTSINTDQTLYRLDLRNYDWNVAISVGGQGFADVWEAMAANDPYAVPFTGTDADAARTASGTRFPVLFADQALSVAAQGDLYYAILGVDVSQPFASWVSSQLGIDLAQNPVKLQSVRAGTTHSLTARPGVLLQRDAMQLRAGTLWQSLPFDPQVMPNVFGAPLGPMSGSGEAIFTLPNQLFGFLAVDDNGRIVTESQTLNDPGQSSRKAFSSTSCSACHVSGLLPAVDEVGAAALANARQLGLDRDQVQSLSSIYPTSQDFAQQVQADTQGSYDRALQELGLPLDSNDPVAAVALRFSEPVQLADAAGDLGLLATELSKNLDQLSPTLGPLKSGSIDRPLFARHFVDSLCILAVVLNNQPEAAACSAAAATH